MFIAFIVLAIAGFNSAIFATLAAGVVAPFITQATKQYFGLSSLRAYALHLGVSAALAVGLLWATGELASVATAAERTSLITLVATTIFQFLKGRSGLEVGDDVKLPEDSE